MNKTLRILLSTALLFAAPVFAQTDSLSSIQDSANAILTAVAAEQSQVAGLNATISQDTNQIAQDQATIASDASIIASDTQQISALQAQLAASASSAQAIPTIRGGLHAQLQWNQNGNVGNSGGGSSQAHGTYTQVLDANGLMSTFTIAPASAYDNYYFDIGNIGGPTKAGKYRFVYHMKFQYRKSGDVAKSQAYEFELQWSDGKYTYNMAWQANLSSSTPTWRYFRYTGTAGTGGWIDSHIPVDVATLNAGGVEDVYATFIVDSSQGTVTHEFLQINGATNPVNVVMSAPAKGEHVYLRVANQLDSKGAASGTVPPAYSVSFAADAAFYPIN